MESVFPSLPGNVRENHAAPPFLPDGGDVDVAGKTAAALYQAPYPSSPVSWNETRRAVIPSWFVREAVRCIFILFRDKSVVCFGINELVINPLPIKVLQETVEKIPYRHNLKNG